MTDAGEFLADARALEVAGVDSIWTAATNTGLDPTLLLAAAAAVTGRVRLGVLFDAEGQTAQSAGQLQTLNWLSRGRGLLGVVRGNDVEVAADPDGPRERWVSASSVDATSLARAGDAGISMLVPMGPGLLDLLRRPDQAEDRSDLILSQG